MSDIKTILQTYLPTDVIGDYGTDFILEFIDDQEIDTCDYGIILEEVSSDYQAGGFSRIQTDANGGDLYECTVIGSTRTQIKNFIGEILKATIHDPDKSYGFKGDDTYSMLICYLENIEKGGDSNWRWAKFPILCVKNNVNLFTDS